MADSYGRLPNHDQIGYCGWCKEAIGYRLGDGPGILRRMAHMREKHPVRRAFAYLVAPLLKGDMLYCPIEWRRVG